MAGGKFSQPRPHRDEERQIEQAFRQVTGQAPKPESPLMGQFPLEPETPKRPQRSVSQDTVLIDEAQLEQTIQQIQNQQIQQAQPEQPQQPTRPVTSQPPVTKPDTFDLLPDDLDSFFEEPHPEEPMDDSEPDFIDKLLDFFQQLSSPDSKKQTAILLAICGVSLVVIVACIAFFFAGASDPNDGNILNNVYLADIPVGGMTKSEAISAVKEATSDTFSRQDMVIDLSGTELRLSPKNTGAKLDVKAAVNEAYQYGRTGSESEKEQALTASRTEAHIIGLLPYLDLDLDYIENTLQTYATDTGSTLTQTTYGLEGREPELDADKFNEHAPTQTLVITLGTPGIGFDVQDVYEQVLDAYSLHTFLVSVENVESTKEPDPIDLEAIYEEFYIEPVDATVNLQTFETVPGKYGYGFNLEEAQKQLDEAEYGDVLRIPMEYIEPEILDGDAFFRDVLGDHQTRHNSNQNRNANLRLACEAMDGTVIDPGESFSFNRTVGQRTSGKGYKVAPNDTAYPDETTLGGGINQVASTLYYAALLSDLDITSRRAGYYAPSFIDYGFDADVTWDMSDLTFRNNLGYPIMIEAEVSGGYVRIKLRGTEERSHYVLLDSTITKTTEPRTEYMEIPYDNREGYKDGDVLQEGITGYTVKTYKVKYDLQSNRQLSQDYVTTTEYPVQNEILAQVLPEETTAPPTVPTTVPPTTTAPPTTVPTTVPPTTEPPASTETQVPETQAPETQAPTESQAPTEPQPPVEPQGNGEDETLPLSADIPEGNHLPETDTPTV